jgi:nicotinamide-nucleotide adenylyltransferase
MDFTGWHMSITGSLRRVTRQGALGRLCLAFLLLLLFGAGGKPQGSFWMDHALMQGHSAELGGGTLRNLGRSGISTSLRVFHQHCSPFHQDSYKFRSLFTMEDMASRIAHNRSLLPTLQEALNSFVSSSALFRVIRTINPPDASTRTVQSCEPQLGHRPKTLFILDSSYNPPSRAHLTLASCALHTTSEPLPHRLLLLFSTHNADKAPSPASFVQRLAMMVLFAEDLQIHVQKLASKDSSAVSVDIGLTKAPYYTDKSTSISSAEPSPYPSAPTHVHLLGYDTVTRFLAPRYYPKFTPPLSALEPFFEPGHKLLVLLRPESSSDNAVSGDTEAEQRKFVNCLADGPLEDEGMKREWAKQISILEGEDITTAAGISSTIIRQAPKKADWEEVRRMCTPGVAKWIQDQQLYTEGG